MHVVTTLTASAQAVRQRRAALADDSAALRGALAAELVRMEELFRSD